MIQEVVAVFGGAAGIIATGTVCYRFGLKRNGYVRTTNCEKRHITMNKQISFVQFLLMEITTDQQQETARHKLKAFKGDSDPTI